DRGVRGEITGELLVPFLRLTQSLTLVCSDCGTSKQDFMRHQTALCDPVDQR
ncbi:hypothetical protein GOODEAATRI_005137, partial [Goodea atripinnis]